MKIVDMHNIGIKFKTFDGTDYCQLKKHPHVPFIFKRDIVGVGINTVPVEIAGTVDKIDHGRGGFRKNILIQGKGNIIIPKVNPEVLVLQYLL
jgi:hypothetical protein